MQPLTFDQLHTLPTVVDLMTAARALGIGRTKAYQLANTGQFPVRIIRVGKGYHIPTADLLKILGVTPVPLPRTTTENQTTETGAQDDCAVTFVTRDGGDVSLHGGQS